MKSASTNTRKYKTFTLATAKLKKKKTNYIAQAGLNVLASASQVLAVARKEILPDLCWFFHVFYPSNKH